MKTEISQFCTVCSQSLGTLPDALVKAAAQFERGGNSLRGTLASLNDLRARLRSLTDKLDSQHAYLLIFGPLKSGKSTLMNAISGSYVSEVTSLPGYPCLVFVQDSEMPRFSVTRYNGRESVFAERNELKAVVDDAHEVLAEHIRAVEERGSAFDPNSDFPEAIRRVDVKLPVPSLGESAMILVDTPGLYSRMNFGYDVLTREFRNSAACAVFVVKSDNLFLEQVFAEFNQLLDLFSRIFVLVNVDSGKRDLAPDGSLCPSAESENPERIVEAFKTLSMAGPLRAAYDAGRVRIHAVDLLNAASKTLTGTNGSSSRPEAFETFQNDLLEFLNSSDYTREFIRDSLRQAHTLCEEIRGTIESDEIANVRSRQETLAKEIETLDQRIAATDRLLQTDWSALFQTLREEHRRRSGEAVSAKTTQLREEIQNGFTRWLAGNESLSALPESYWNPALTQTARSLAENSIDLLTRMTGSDDAGLNAPANIAEDLRVAGFSPVESGRQAFAAARAEDEIESYRTTIAADSIPVHKTFVDWILFRGQSSVRKRLFGEDGKLEILPAEKEKRLTPESRAEVEQQWEAALRERFPAKPVAFAMKLVDTYASSAAENIRAGLRALRDNLSFQRDDRRSPFEVQSEILRVAEELRHQAESVSGDIDLLSAKETESESAAAEILGDSASTPDSDFIPNPGMLPPLDP